METVNKHPYKICPAKFRNYSNIIWAQEYTTQCKHNVFHTDTVRNVCKQYYSRITNLEDVKYDVEQIVKAKDFQVLPKRWIGFYIRVYTRVMCLSSFFLLIHNSWDRWLHSVLILSTNVVKAYLNIRNNFNCKIVHRF